MLTVTDWGYKRSVMRAVNGTWFTIGDIWGNPSNPNNFTDIDLIALPIVCTQFSANATVNNDEACAGDIRRLNANISGGSGAFSISWTPTAPPNNIFTPFNEITDVQIGQTTTFTVTVIDLVSNDTVTSDVTVTANSITVTTSDDTLGCGGSVTLTASPGGSLFQASFLWSNGTLGLNNTVTSPGVYTVTASNGFGCSATATATVTLPGTNQQVSFTYVTDNPANNQIGCKDGTITFTNNATHKPGWTWIWNFGDGSGIISSLENPTYAYTSTGNFTVTLTADSANCPVSATPKTITVVSCPTGTGGSFFVISPANDSIPCVVVGVPYTFVLNFSIGPSIGPVGVNFTRIDSITGLPSGINYQLDRPSGLYTPPNTQGFMVLSGTTNAPPGVYSIDIYVTIDIPGIGLVSGELYDLMSQFAPGTFTQPELQVINPGGFCSTTSDISVSVSSTAATCGNADGTATVAVTGGSGNYSYQWSPVAGTDSFLTGLSAGTYTVIVTDDTTGAVATASVTVEGSCGTISGHIFYDANGNGVQDAGENGLSGITVKLLPGTLTGVTNQNGDYSISVGAFDTFLVSVDLPSRYYCSGTAYLTDSVTLPVGNIHTVIITQNLPDATSIDFGLSLPQPPCGVISGHVFNDLNGNGVKDPGEPGKDGISIQLSNGQNAQTDINGDYSVEVFFNVPVTISLVSSPSSYFCGPSVPYYIQTFPVSPSTYNVTLNTGLPNAFGYDFGVTQTSASFDVSIASIRSFSCIYAGRDFIAWMDFKANGNITDTCCLRLTFDPLVSFISATLTPTTVTGTYVEWCFPPGTAPSFYCVELVWQK